METTPGTMIPIRNLVTGETAPFEVLEMASYRGAGILYGVVGEHGFINGRQPMTVQERAGCFPVLSGENAEDVAQLTSMIGGLPLTMEISGKSSLTTRNDGQTMLAGADLHLMPILNIEKTLYTLRPEIERGEGGIPTLGQRDTFLQRSRRLVDLYMEWTETRELPLWFRVFRNDRRN
jgi:hypothetical protein